MAKLSINGGLLALAAMSLPVMAEQATGSKQWTFDVGMGALAVAMPFKGVDTEGVVLPYVGARYGNWSFGVEQLVGYKHKLNKDWAVTGGLNYRSDGYDGDGSFFSIESDDPVFNGYDSPDGELILSGGLRWKFVSIKFGQDVLDNSGASMAKLNFDIPLYMDERGVRVKAGVGADWHSEDYVNHNYGISAEQVDLSVGRTAYSADAATNYYASVRMMYPIDKRWKLMAIASRSKLDDNISNSPLVDSQYDSSIIMAVTYRM